MAPSKEKEFTLRTCPKFTLPCRHGTTRAPGFTLRIRWETWSRWAASIKSHLFNKQTSLIASCSRRSCANSDPPPSNWSKFEASQTHTTLSKRKDACTNGSVKNVCATGKTSESPEHSTKRESSGLPSRVSPVSESPAKRLKASTRSPLTRQQRQPLGITIVSEADFSNNINWSSIGTLPNSFCTTAMRCPWPKLLRTKFKKVVFPAPRKPVKIVAGIRCSCSWTQASASRICSGVRPLSSFLAFSQKMHMASELSEQHKSPYSFNMFQQKEIQFRSIR